MARVYNFSAGPSMLPEPVLERARDELLEFRDTGMSVMEMSHRGRDFVGIAEKAEADLRDLLAIPANYRVLFLPGGATAQFAAVPMNLLRGKTRACYLSTGLWSEKALAEAQRYATVTLAASGKADGFTRIPPRDEWHLDPEAAYFHYTANETINGVEFHTVPEVDGLPLVSDMSSNLLSRPLEVERFGLIYAGAQKNMGPAGIAVVIVRDDLVGQPLPSTPSLLDYRKQAEQGSMLNTPPTYNWYLLGLVLEWLKDEGPGGARGPQSAQGQQAVCGLGPLGVLFQSGGAELPLTHERAVPAGSARARTLVPQGGESRRASQPGGPPLGGGLRASIYNAMPEAGWTP